MQDSEENALLLLGGFKALITGVMADDSISLKHRTALFASVVMEANEAFQTMKTAYKAQQALEQLNATDKP